MWILEQTQTLTAAVALIPSANDNQNFQASPRRMSAWIISKRFSASEPVTEKRRATNNQVESQISGSLG